ncbi:MAG: hypothetical protein COB09_18725 [Thalassobium sp.]|nr:MAG: hypothetical protein COB09_18725 [Thalassobium sp.]
MNTFVKVLLTNESLELGTKGAWLQNNRTIEIFLQRQGCARSFYCYHPEFAIELMTWQGTDQFCLKMGKVFNTYYSFAEAVKDIPEILKRQGIKRTVVINSQIMDYMYGMDMYPYQNDDRIISPFFYCEYSDTIRTVKENYCLLSFGNGKFDKRNYIVDYAEGAARHLGNFEKAISTGFHACDMKKGQSYCKRRLAWLAGEYAISEFEGNIHLAFVNKDMTRIKRP